MIASKSYVRLDDQDVFRIGSTRISLDSVVHAFLQGHSPEAIQDQYPGLSLEEVYGTLAFYLANRDEVHQYLDKQQQKWEELKGKCSTGCCPAPVATIPPMLTRSRSRLPSGTWDDQDLATDGGKGPARQAGPTSGFLRGG